MAVNAATAVGELTAGGSAGRIAAFLRPCEARAVVELVKLKQVNLYQCFVPSSEGQVRAVLNGWGASILPEILVRPHIESGQLVDLAPGTVLHVKLYWHCWNLDSAVLNSLSEAVILAAKAALS